MLDTRIADPLWASTDARLYVPTESTESALSALDMGLRAGCSPVLLSGPRGIGKTLLLRVLAERESSAFPRTWLMRLSDRPNELAGVLLRLLFDVVPPRRARAAQEALLAELRARGDERTLLLVDDIHEQSESSIRKLAELARAAKPALAVVVAGTGCEDRRDLSDALGAGLSVLLPESLPDPEIAALYDAIVAHPGLSPRLKLELGESDRAEITRLACGVPERLKRELARRRPGRAPIVPELDSPLRELVADDEAELVVEEYKELVEAERPESLRVEIAAAAPRSEAATAPLPAFRVRRTRLRGNALLLVRWAWVFVLIGVEGARDALSRAPGALARARRSSTSWIHTAAASGRDQLARERVRLARAPGTLIELWSGSRAPAALARARRSSTSWIHTAAGRCAVSLREGASFASRLGAHAVASGREQLARERARLARAPETLIELWSVSGAPAALASARRSSTHWIHTAAGRCAVSLRESAGVASRLGAHAAASGREQLARERARLARARVTLVELWSVRVARAVEAERALARSTLRGAQRVLTRGAVPGALLLAAAVFLQLEHSPAKRAREAPLAPAAVSARPAARPVAALVARPALPPIDVHVNARPWARVWIDGVDLGPTPLRRRLSPGVHPLEAELPNGQRIHRQIEISAAHHFVSLP